MKKEPVPTAFAVLDILGYGALMRQEPNEVLNLVQELINSDTIFRPVQIDLEKYAHFSGTVAPIIEHLQFSDTLLIWLSSDQRTHENLQTPAQLVQSVCYAASRTLASFIATGFPLRGTVGFGYTFISRDPLFFTGCELYEATKLERKQAWAGVALHNSAVKALKEESSKQFIVEYLVPMSEETDTNPEYAIDWVTYFKCYQPLPPPWEQTCSQALEPPWDQMFISTDTRVKKKGEETKLFFEVIKEQQRSYSAPLHYETIMAMRERLSGILLNH